MNTRTMASAVILLMLFTIGTPFLQEGAKGAQSAGTGLATGTISGFVHDEDDVPLSGVTVRFNGGNSVVTDLYGRFTSQSLLDGDYTVEASNPGFASTSVYNVSTGSSGIGMHLTPYGWVEMDDDAFGDGFFRNIEAGPDGLSLEVTDDPVLPVSERFFLVANDYMNGSNWHDRNMSRGRVWYVDINADGSIGDMDEVFDPWEVVLDGFTLNARGLPMADFDNDGDYDFVVPKIYYNNVDGWKYFGLWFVENQGVDVEGHRQFGVPTAISGSSFSMNRFLMDAATEDFDGDGNYDFIVSGNNDDLYLFEGDGAGGFARSTITTNAPDGYCRGKDAGDINNDGNMDLVVATYNDGEVYAYFGDGAGGFSSPAYLFDVLGISKDPYGVTVADYNNDGAQDIVTNDGANNINTLWLGDGTGTNFQSTDTIFDLSSGGGSDNFDIDRDGDQDIVTIYHGTGGRVFWMENHNDGMVWLGHEAIAYDYAAHKRMYTISTPPTAKRYETSGVYVSEIHDTRNPLAKIAQVEYDHEQWPNQTITVQVRSSDNADMSGASGWETVIDGDNTISTPSGRYVQYQVLMNSIDTSSPRLGSIKINYFVNPVWINGTIWNTASDEIPGATVSLMSDGYTLVSDVTDADGEYSLLIGAGTYNYRVEAENYNEYNENLTVTVTANKNTVIKFQNVWRETTEEDFEDGVDLDDVWIDDIGAVTLSTNIALDKTVYTNVAESAGWESWRINDGTSTSKYQSTHDAGAVDGYKNNAWVAIDFGSMYEVDRADYFMSSDARFWQSGFTIEAYEDFDPVTGNGTNATTLVSYPQGTWTTASDCPDNFVFTDGAEFEASNGSTVSGWLPANDTVNARWIRLKDVYGNFTYNDDWHRYRAAELSVYTPLMEGSYTSSIWNTSDATHTVSCVIWDETVLDNASVTIKVRVGDDPSNMGAWGTVNNMERLPGTQVGQYIQYKVIMQSLDGKATPSLSDIRIFYYINPGWIYGTVTLENTGTALGGAKVIAEQMQGQLDPVVVITDASGEYVIPVEFPDSGTFDYHVSFSKNGLDDADDIVSLTPILDEQELDMAMVPDDDWSMNYGNFERTSASYLPSNIYAAGVKWRYTMGGLAEHAWIEDVNGDNRNDIVMAYGDRVVAKAPDNTLIWVARSGAVDRVIGVKDLDKNGVMDVIAANKDPARIVVVNGINGTVQYEETWPNTKFDITGPDNEVIADFDGTHDGQYELLFKLHDGFLRAWTFNTVGTRAVPTELWTVPYSYHSKNSIALGDVDLDGDEDVVVFNGMDYVVQVFNADDGTLKYQTSWSKDPYPSIGSIAIRDLDPSDDIGNIILMFSEPSNSYNTVDQYSYDGFTVMDCNDTVVSESYTVEIERSKWGNQRHFEWMADSISDVDGDGVLEFVASSRNISAPFGKNRWITYVWDLRNGTVEAQFGSPGYSLECRGLINLDDDVQKEILLQKGNRWVLIDGDHDSYSEKWNESGYQDAYWHRQYQGEQAAEDNWFGSGQFEWAWWQQYGPNAYGDIDGDGLNELFLWQNDPAGFVALNANGSSLDTIWHFPEINRTTYNPRMFMRGIGNLTGNSSKEAMIVTDDGYLFAIDSTGSYETVTTGGWSDMPKAADLNDDDSKEVIIRVNHDRTTVVINTTGATFLNEPTSVPTHTSHDNQVIVDYDNDGKMELITESWRRISCQEYDGENLTYEWNFTRDDFEYGSEMRIYEFGRMQLGYFNSDDVLDFFFAYKNFSYSEPNEWSEYVNGIGMFDGKTRTVVWYKDFTNLRWPVVYDWDDDGLDDLVCQHDDIFKVIDGLTGEYHQWTMNSPIDSRGGNAIGQADGDIEDELLISYEYDLRYGVAAGVDIFSGEVLWHALTTDYNTEDAKSGYGLVADVDGDGVDEIGQSTSEGVFLMMDDSGELMWAYDVNDPYVEFTPATAADLDLDGIFEILFGGSDGILRVLNSNNGTLDWQFDFGFAMEQPIVAEMDEIYGAEILVSCQDGYLYCLANVNKAELVINEQDVTSLVNQPDGEEVDITAKIRNLGGIEAEDVTVVFLDNGDVFHTDVIDVAAGGWTEVSVTWTASPVGNHTINITVDPNNDILELDEDNNNFERVIYVWPVPDMAITYDINDPNTMKIYDEVTGIGNPDAKWSFGPFYGFNNTLSVRVHNLGPVAAENFYINLSDNGQPVDSLLISLGANTAYWYNFTWYPIGDIEDSHTLEIDIDPPDSIAEANEDNNFLRLGGKDMVFINPPEIILEKHNIKMTGDVDVGPGRIGVIEGDILHVEMKVENEGTANSAYTGVLVYIDVNRDNKFDVDNDIYINIDPKYDVRDRWSFLMDLIWAHNTTTKQFEIDTSPLRTLLMQKTGSDAIESYPLIIQVDPTDLIPEKHNDNSVNVGDLLVVPLLPELEIENNDIKPSVEAFTIIRSQFQIYVVVHNLGGSDADGVLVKLWDNSEFIGQQTVDVPAVSQSRSYEDAYAVAVFDNTFYTTGQHTLLVQISWDNGTEAVADQNNNEAAITIKANGRNEKVVSSFQVTMMSLAAVALLGAALREWHDRKQ